MSDALFGKKILERLDVATSKIVDKVVKEALEIALENADSPTKWPVEIESESVKDIMGGSRMLDVLVDRLGKYGISVYTSHNDYVVIDVIDVIDVVEMDDKTYSETVLDETESDEIKSKDLVTAATARKITADCNADRMSESYSFVAEKILKEANAGANSVDLILSSKPISGNIQVIKRIAKRLLSLGYGVSSGKRKIVIEARPDYAKMKTLNIVWKK